MIDKILDKINKIVPAKFRWVLEHGGFRKYFKNTGWMFLGQIFSMGASFIATIIIARRLGPENYGQLSYAVSFISIFSIFASLGIESILYRDLIKYPEKKKEYLGTAFIIRILSGAMAVLLVLISTKLFVSDTISKILILIISGTFIFGAFKLIVYEFQARVKSKYPSITTVIVSLILNTLKIVVVMSGKGVIYLALLLLLESLLYAGFYLFFYRQKVNGRIFQWKFNKSIGLKLLKDSWPLMFMSAFGLIYSRIDQIFIKHIIDAFSVGVYSAAVVLSEIWTFIPSIIVVSLFPAIVNSKKISQESYYSRLKHTSFLLILLAVFIALIITLLAPLIINLIYGADFVGGVKVLQIYVWASISTFLTALIYNYLVVESYKKVLLFISFVPMVINIVLNLIWIPKYGIVGAALATLVSYSFGPLTLLLFKKTRKDLINIFSRQRSL